MRIFYVFTGKGGLFIFTMRTYDFQNHCCKQCGMLMAQRDFRLHTLNECFLIEMENLKVEKLLKEEICKNFVPNAEEKPNL